MCNNLIVIGPRDWTSTQHIACETNLFRIENHALSCCEIDVKLSENYLLVIVANSVSRGFVIGCFVGSCLGFEHPNTQLGYYEVQIILLMPNFDRPMA